jgi:hypothetical protein
MEYAHISFNPKKCKILIHNAEKITIPALYLPDANGTEQEVEVCDIRGRGYGLPNSVFGIAQV